VVSKIYLATDSSPVDMQSYELCADMIDVITDVSSIYGGEEAEEAAPPPAAPGATSSSNCVISLNNGTVLVLREVNRSLALVCILKSHALAQQARPVQGVAVVVVALAVVVASSHGSSGSPRTACAP